MLTYRDTSVVFILVFLGLMSYDYAHDLSVWYYITTVLLFGLAIFLGSYFIQSGFFLKAHCDGEKRKNQIAITFDDGPHENTSMILDVLKRNNATATFFCIGKNIEGREDTIRRIAEEGHIVSNHSYSHHNFFDFFAIKKLKQDVVKTDDLILKITGKRNKLFRPPFGVTTPNIAQMVKEMDYSVIGWNLRSYDTSIKDHERLLKRILTRIENGSVILLHDTTPGIEIVLQKVLDHAREKNLKVVSIEELFQINAYETA